MQFIYKKTEDGKNKRKISMYCKVLGVSRQGFYNYLKNKDKPWKYQWVADLIYEILKEDACNDTYGRYRMYEALKIRYPDKPIPCERTIYRIMGEMGIVHKPRRKPNGITKADKEARKSDDLIKRDFRSDKPLATKISDIVANTL